MADKVPGREQLEKLVKQGYLQSMPVDPGFGSDSFSHYVAEEEGVGIACTVHGHIPYAREPWVYSGHPLGRAFGAERGLLDMPRTAAEAVALSGPVTAEGLELAADATQATFADLARAAQSARSRTRSLSALALRRLRDPRGLPVLRDLLRDPDEYVRKQAAWSLGNIGSLADAPALLPLLSDPAERVRDFAAYALARLGDAKGAEASLAVLANTARNPIRRGEAAQALGDGKHAAAIPRLQEILASAPIDAELKVRVEEALTRLGAPPKRG